MATDTYTFSEDYQKRIVALMCKDPEFLKAYKDVVDPKYFDFSYLTTISRIVLEVFDKHQQIPSKEALSKQIQDFCISFNIDMAMTESFLGKVDEIYAIDVFDRNVVKDDVIKFGKHQAMKRGVMKIVDFIHDINQYDKAREVIDAALKVGTNTLDLGMNFFDKLPDFENIIKRRMDVGNRIPTQIPLFDHYTLGGPAKKELWVIMGYTKTGKSQFLLNMAVSALELGLVAAYVTIGDLTEEDIFIRTLSRMTFTPQEEMLTITDELKRKAEKLMKYSARYFKIKYYPSFSITPQNIRMYLSNLYAIDNVKPDILILDYIDEMKPYCEDMYLNGGRQYAEMKEIVADFNLLGWTGSQVSRTKTKKAWEPIKMDNISNSYQKAFKCDGAVSINECIYRNGVTNPTKSFLYLDGIRRGSGGKYIYLDVDFSMSLLQQSHKQGDDDTTDAGDLSAAERF